MLVHGKIKHFRKKKRCEINIRQKEEPVVHVHKGINKLENLCASKQHSRKARRNTNKGAMRHHSVSPSSGKKVVMKQVSTSDLTVNRKPYQSITKKLICLCIYATDRSALRVEKTQQCVRIWEHLCVLACQTRFSSFPPHVPLAHRLPLSQSMSSETTCVSSGALRAERHDEPVCTNAHLQALNYTIWNVQLWHAWVSLFVGLFSHHCSTLWIVRWVGKNDWLMIKVAVEAHFRTELV